MFAHTASACSARSSGTLPSGRTGTTPAVCSSRRRRVAEHGVGVVGGGRGNASWDDLVIHGLIMSHRVDMVSGMPTMKITSSGQISLPADVRRRWGVKRVRLVDHGDHVTLEPIPDDVFTATFGRSSPRPGSRATRCEQHGA